MMAHISNLVIFISIYQKMDYWDRRKKRWEMKTFNPHSTWSERAVQAWQILIGYAYREETITYDDLSFLMFRVYAPRIMGRILGRIAFYCDANDMPQLNVVAINKATGVPGDGIPLDYHYYEGERKRAFEFDWYDIYTPTAEDLKESACLSAA